MRTLKRTKIKKSIRANVIATPDVVRVKFPKQLVQTIALEFNGKIVRQWEIYLIGDQLKTERLT